MDINTCINYVHNYLNWLDKKFVIECKDDSFCHIITPFLRQDNDHIEVFIEKEGDNIVLTDDGATFEYLYLSGIDLNSPTRKNYVFSISNRTQCIFDGYEIKCYIESLDDFGIRFNNFINSIMSISNLTYTANPRGKATFKDDVIDMFASWKINYNSQFINGYTKEHHFDFVIMKKKIIIVEPISTASVSYGIKLAESLAFKFNDIRKNNITFIGVSLVNDREDIWTPEILTTLEKNSDEMVSWSNRNRIKDIIAA